MMRLVCPYGFALVCALIGPLLTAQTPQPPASVRQLRDLTNKWRKDIHDGQDVEKRRQAVEGFMALTSELSGIVANLDSKLLDPDPEIRLNSAKGLANIGPGAVLAVPNLIGIV